MNSWNFRLLAACFVGWLILAILSYFFVDMPVTIFIHDHWLRDRREFWGDWLSVPGQTEYYLVPVGVVIAVVAYYRRFDLIWLWLLAVVQIGGASLCATPLKYIFGRYRPNVYFSAGDFGWIFFRSGYSMNSFPSGHTTTAAAVAAVLCLRFPKWKLLWILLPVIVGAGRVIALAHYLSDVMGAVLLTVPIVLAMEYFVRYKKWIVVTDSSRGIPVSPEQAAIAPVQHSADSPARDAQHSTQ